MTLRLFLLRHGETEWNQTGRFQGVTDIPLGQTGRQQATALAHSLRGERLSAVYASPLCRALETAQLLAAPHGLEVETCLELREMDLGELEGASREMFVTQFASLAARWRECAWTVQMPGGESLPLLQERVWGAIERIVARHKTGSVAVVAHSFANAVALCKAAGLDLSHYREFRQSPSAKNLIELSNGIYRVVLVNDTSHLSHDAPDAGPAVGR
ncbi:MAG: histidine phosphatase family protein [Chloroflexi bacterium]|nr:histidine phosphatase family protein [Chloroflexota bacterium]MCL5026627.1 histidine phosphatase family protein [Chloroflexota bacterium]